jgi:hypothetical protein
VTVIHLRGIAHQERPGVSGLDPASIVPETVPVHVEYDYSKAIGTAALRRNEADTIWADVTAEDGPWRETCRYFGMSFRAGHLAAVPGAGLGEAIAVSLVAKTAPWSGLPPFEVLSGPASD